LEKTDISILLYFNSPLADMHPGKSAGINRFINSFINLPASIKLNLFFNGFRIQELYSTSQNLLKRLFAIANSGIIEFLAGAFYEPDFSIIPEESINKQVIISKEYYKDKFDYIPKTFFIPQFLSDKKISQIALKNDFSRIVRLVLSKQEDIICEGMPVLNANILLGKKLLSRTKLDNDIIKKTSIIPFPGDILSNETGIEWFLKFISEMNKKYNLRLINELKIPLVEGKLKEIDIKEKLIHDIFYNFPFYAFFESDFPSNTMEIEDDILKNYYNIFPEQKRLLIRLKEIRDCLDSSERKDLFAHLEFHGFTQDWPGISSSLNYNFLRHRFIKDCMNIQKEACRRTLNIIETEKDIFLRSKPFNLIFDKNSFALKLLDHIECGYSMTSINYPRKELLKIRDMCFGKLSNPVEIKENKDRGMLFDEVKIIDDKKNYFIKKSKGNAFLKEKGDVISIISNFEFKDKHGYLSVQKKLSLRKSNNYIFVNYLLENKEDKVITYLFRTGIPVGLSYPHTPGNRIEYSDSKGKAVIGFERKLKKERLKEISIWDQLLGLNIVFNFAEQNKIFIEPVYLFDRLPEQLQRIYQGIVIFMENIIKLSPREKKKIEMNFRINRA